MTSPVRSPPHRPSPDSATPPPPAASLRVRVLAPAALDAADLRAWAALEARALEPNAFLSPHFVLPALRHLNSPQHVELWLVERSGDAGPALVGVGVFHLQKASRLCPFPHWALWRSRHSFLGGLLLDRDVAPAALQALLAHARRPFGPAMALVLADCDVQGPLAQCCEAVLSRRGLVPARLEPYERAELRPAEAGEAALCALPARRTKELRRCRRRLEDLGRVDWRCLRGREGETELDAALSTFLRLEHDSWKGEGGSSLQSRPGDAAFFTEMMRGFGHDGRAFLTELTLDGRVVASTANLVSGHEGFAFKVAWDRALRSLGPGLLNEVELLRRAPTVAGDLRRIDSGAEAGSFIDSLWTGRRTLATLVLPLGRRGQAAMAAAAWARRLKQKLRPPRTQR